MDTRLFRSCVNSTSISESREKERSRVQSIAVIGENMYVRTIAIATFEIILAISEKIKKFYDAFATRPPSSTLNSLQREGKEKKKERDVKCHIASIDLSDSPPLSMRQPKRLISGNCRYAFHVYWRDIVHAILQCPITSLDNCAQRAMSDNC